MRFLIAITSALCCFTASQFGCKAVEHPIGWLLTYAGGFLAGVYICKYKGL